MVVHRNYKQLVDTTVEISNKVEVADIVGRIVEDLKMKVNHIAKW
jgi:splicing factor 3B subunit 1